MGIFNGTGKGIFQKEWVALMNEVIIYGLGSFFSRMTDFKDIDILILHRNTSYGSCQFSILCKKHFLFNIPAADITILSDSEERQFAFLEKSKAVYLGKVYEKSFENDLNAIYAKVSRS